METDNSLNLRPLTKRFPFELIDDEERTLETEITKILQQRILQDKSSSEPISDGLLYAILAENPHANDFFQQLQLIKGNDFRSVISTLQYFLEGKFLKLQTYTVYQILWILNRMLKSKIQESLELLTHFGRNIILEELSEVSKRLAERYCRIIEDNIEFILENPGIIAVVFLKLCKFLAGWQAFESDATNRNLINKLLVLIWERAHRSCLNIGRELLRVTQTALKSDDFKYFIDQFSSKSPISENKVIKDLLDNAFGSHPLIDLIRINLSANMQSKLDFILNDAPYHCLDRYMKWLAADYKINPTNSARELLWVEVIRYLIAIFHPPPEFFNPSLAQRWQIILWILIQVKNPLAKASIKQALFFDWIFFDPQRDDPLNLEPATLIIQYCLVKHTPLRNLGYELLEYLVHFNDQYFPGGDRQKLSLRQAFNTCVERKYVENWDFVLTDSRLHQDLRSILKEIVDSKPKLDKIAIHHDIGSPKMEEEDEDQNGFLSPKSPEVIEEDGESGDGYNPETKIYDPLLELYNSDQSLKSPTLMGKRTPNYSQMSFELNDKELRVEPVKVDINSLNIRESFKETYLKQIQELLEKPSIESFDIFLQEFREKKLRSKISINLQQEDFDNFCAVLMSVFKREFSNLYPTGTLNFVNYYLNTACSASRNNMNLYTIYKKITEALTELEPMMSTHYFYFIMVSNEKLPQIFEDDYFKIFTEKLGFSHVSKDLMNLYCVLEQEMFLDLLNTALHKFPTQAKNNSQFISTMIELAPADFLLQIKMEISDGTLRLFDENCYRIVRESLSWTSYNQLVLWDLIQSQFMSFNKMNQPEFFSKMVQEMNLFNKNQGELPPKDMLMGFRSLLVFVLSGFKEELEFVEIVSIVLELGPNYALFVYSILNQSQINLVKLAIRSFLKVNGEKAEKMKSLTKHLSVWKEKDYHFRGDRVALEDQLKTLIIKALRKVGIQDDESALF